MWEGPRRRPPSDAGAYVAWEVCSTRQYARITPTSRFVGPALCAESGRLPSRGFVGKAWNVGCVLCLLSEKRIAIPPGPTHWLLRYAGNQGSQQVAFMFADGLGLGEVAAGGMAQGLPAGEGKMTAWGGVGARLLVLSRLV